PSPLAPDQALEYHRLMLQQLAAEGETADGLVNQALFGHTLFARGRMREAQVVFESIVAREPDEAFPYSMLGSVYLAQNDLGRALALFDAALTMDPTDPSALVNRAEIRLRRGQAKLALKDLDRALEQSQQGPGPFLARARTLFSIARSLVR
ncbi:MAG: tetratricopeptide repeat protein, partial [Myxococcales bacterium]